MAGSRRPGPFEAGTTGLTPTARALDTERAPHRTPSEETRECRSPSSSSSRLTTFPGEPVAGSTTGGAGGPGVEQKILALDRDTGDVTRLLRFAAGVETRETITHDFWEEVWILAGELMDLGKGQTFTAGMYACRPPGMVHGPYRVPRGCTTLELRYGKAAAR